jgi:pyruvate carboxylase
MNRGCHVTGGQNWYATETFSVSRRAFPTASLLSVGFSVEIFGGATYDYLYRPTPFDSGRRISRQNLETLQAVLGETNTCLPMVYAYRYTIVALPHFSLNWYG